jgi:hypothetical protein
MTTFLFVCTAWAENVNQGEVPTTTIDYVVNNLDKTRFNIVASIEFDNGAWHINAIVPDPGKENVDKTGDFVYAHGMHVPVAVTETEYTLSDKGELAIVKTKKEDAKVLPPAFSALKAAVDTVMIADKDIKIRSVKFDNGSWIMKAVKTSVDSNTGVKTVRFVKYIVGADGRKILYKALGE